MYIVDGEKKYKSARNAVLAGMKLFHKVTDILEHVG